MYIPKPDIEKFTIRGDFSLWKMKMRALFVHQGFESALDEMILEIQSLMRRKDRYMTRLIVP